MRTPIKKRRRKGWKMTTETTVKVTCDRCEETHYEGPQQGRPEYVRVTFWSADPRPSWDADDLCKSCADEFMKMVCNFAAPQKKR